MNEGKPSILMETLSVVAVIGVAVAAVCVPIWMLVQWVEQRWGAAGDTVLAAIALVLLTIIVVMAIGLLFARIYRSGVVDAVEMHANTTDADTRSTVAVANALRQPMVNQSRLELMNERRVHELAAQRAKLLTVNQQQTVDAEYWQLPADADSSGVRFES